ncbi:hypothetical protein L3Y34_003827 [Caenorhabditis briggsae]|uniref:Uncharacterized protein n=3 Tax=Caenorhabditis briggsae TaxID=6238 RepID=A0AAE9A7D0_CAEBR|nr:hypothetical protein L3Y34_003827 [Caenorhabditis briggsae]
MKIFINIIIFLAFFYESHCALPNCANGVACPPGGIWSEWVTTDRCSTDCGSCSTMYYTRTCMTSPTCSCTGNNTHYLPCNTQTCVYPAQRACCVPYVPMVIDGKQQCGPFPKDTGAAACCPTAGVWSEWGPAVRNSDNTAFEQSRTCLSAAAGCTCTGNRINPWSSDKCPCPDFQTDLNDKLLEPTESFSIRPSGVVYDRIACTYTTPLNSTEWNCSSSRGYQSTTLLRYIRADNGEREDYRVGDCKDTSDEKHNVTFYCDFSTLQWRLTNNNVAVLTFNQVSKKR